MTAGRLSSAFAPRALTIVLLTSGLVGALWAYAPVLDNAFVCDDYAYLLVGRTLASRPSLLWHQHDVYRLYLGAMRRPLGNAVWAGLVSVCGTDPAPYYVCLLLLHVLNGALVFALFRRQLGQAPTAAVGAALFWCAYGGRNAVCWISNLNESLLLAVALLLLLAQPRPWLAALAVAAGCLIKESLAPIFLVLLAADRLGPAPARHRDRDWAAGAALLALYVLWRVLGKAPGDYQQAALGGHLLRSWPALVAAAFGSDIVPVFLDRVVQAPAAWLPLAWLVTAAVALTAVAARGPARWLAVWVLVQPLPYTLLPSTTPRCLPSHYLYAATVPAMGLVAVGLAALFRRYRGQPLVLTPVLLAALLVLWCGWCVQRIQFDERTHWQDASERLRRDFAVFDRAALPPGTHLVLVITPEETPAGGTWWGWEGYPQVSRTPVTLTRLNAWPADPAALPAPVALFGYDKARGPWLAARRDR